MEENWISLITRKNVSIWVDKDEQSFENLEQLLEDARIDNVCLLDSWNQIEFGVLY